MNWFVPTRLRCTIAVLVDDLDDLLLEGDSAMTVKPESGNGDARPAYLDSLVGRALTDDRRCLDWKENYPHLRSFLMGEAKGLVDTGTKLCVQAGQRGLTVTVQTQRYGYQARYDDIDLPSILEAIDNDLDCGTVPWEPDWRRKRENSKRLEI